MTDRQPKIVAVFGATGGIGRAICDVLLADDRVGALYAGGRDAPRFEDGRVRPFSFDLADEPSIEAAARLMVPQPPQTIIVATGALTLPDGTGPERSFRKLDRTAMLAMFGINTIGPALIAKHCLPLMPRRGRSEFAALSARVGSISDNKLGGWHSYRASKAGLNMLLRNFAVELRRTHAEAIVVGLHPGTVDTRLSEPFQSNLPEGQLTERHEAARRLLAVLSGLHPSDSGNQFDYRGRVVPA